MIITTYQNNSPRNYANKSLTVVGDLTGTLKEGSDITAPAILVRNTILPTFNYAYIDAFHRYYYVTGKTNVTNGLWRINFKCDVLMSFWNEAKECPCIVARNEFKRTSLLIDDELYATADTLYGVGVFPNSPLLSGSATRRYVMVLQGAGTGTV